MVAELFPFVVRQSAARMLGLWVVASALAACGNTSSLDPENTEQSRQAVLISGLSGTGLKIELNGYEGTIYRGPLAAPLAVAPGPIVTLDLPPGQHRLWTYESIAIGSTNDWTLATISVDESGNATVDTAHFDRVPAQNALRAKLVPFTLDSQGYGGAFTFGFNKMYSGSFSTALFADRAYLLYDVGSSFMGVKPGYHLSATAQLFIRRDNTSSLGPDMAQSFTLDPTTRTLRAKVQPISIVYNGNHGAIGIGETYKHGPDTATIPVLVNRDYGMLDYASIDPASSPTQPKYPFSGVLTVSANGAVTIDAALAAHFALAAGSTRLEARVAAVTFVTSGHFYIQGLSMVASTPPVTRSMLLGRRVGMGPVLTSFAVGHDASCSPTTLPVQGGSVTLTCRPHSSVHSGMTAEGLTFDPNGYTGEICVGTFGCFSGTPQSFNLPVGTHQIVSQQSTGNVEPFVGSNVLGSVTVDANGVATVNSPHFERLNASQLRAKTVLVNVNCAGYPCELGWDASGARMTGTSVTLLAGRRFSPLEYSSQHLTDPSSRIDLDGGVLLDEHGGVGLGPTMAESFTWDAAARTLRARTVPVTIDYKGYPGTFAFGTYAVPGPGVQTWTLLRNRRYDLRDGESSDPVSGSAGFAAAADARLDKDQLVLGADSARYFRQPSAERRLEAIVGTVFFTSTGAFSTGGGTCLQSDAAGSGASECAMLMGRRYPLAPGNAWWTFAADGTCSPATFGLPGGGSASFNCRAQGAPPAPRLSVEVVSGTRIDLSWTMPWGDQTGFRAQRFTPNATAWTDVVGCNVGALATSCSDTNGVAAGVSYKYRLIAFNLFGQTYSNEVTIAMQAPAAPIGLAARVVSPTAVDLTWQNVGVGISANVVQRKTGTAEFAEIARLAPTAQAYRDPGLPLGNYTYRVIAENGAGAAASAEVLAALLPPSKPLAVNVVPSTANQIDVSWTPDGTSALGFRIARSTEGAAFVDLMDVSAPATSFADTTARVNTSYRYSVTALNSAGASEATISTTVRIAIATTPLGFSASVTGAGQISLFWLAGPDESGYRLEYQNNNGAWVPISRPPNVHSYVHSNLMQTGSYRYRLYALSVFGASQPAELPYAITPAAPPTPTGFHGVALSAGRIEMRWGATSNNENDYQIRWTQGTATQSQTLPRGSRTAIFTGLNTSNYAFELFARNGAGVSRAAVTARVTAASQPTGLTATAGPNLTMTLAWTDVANNEEKYEVSRANSAGGPWEEKGPLPVNTRTWTDSQLGPSVQYFYRVRAVNPMGASPYATVNQVAQNPCAGQVEGGACSDGNLCTTNDRCDATGKCVGTGTVQCNDGNPCTRDVCVMLTGACTTEPMPPATDCNDNNVCTLSSQCDGTGLCVGTANVVCPDDGNPCTADVCVPFTQGCTSSLTGSCDFGVQCQPNPAQSPPLVCDAVFPITVDGRDIDWGNIVITEPVSGFASNTPNTTPIVLQLRSNIQYFFRAEGGLTEGSFTVTPAGLVSVQDSDTVRGNGTTTLVLLDPDKPQPKIDWEMEERFGLNDDIRVFHGYPSDGAPRPVSKQVNPPYWNVYLDACGSRSPGTTVVTYRWEITPAGTASPARIEQFTECRGLARFEKLGTYDVTLKIDAATGRSATTQGQIVLKDHLVVSMGDSYASGEGNPILPLADTFLIQKLFFLDWLDMSWDDPRRRLSRWSGHAQAALMLERSDPHSSVTFITSAHSGASIATRIGFDGKVTGGILGPMPVSQRPTNGYNEDVKFVEPQIDFVAKEISQCVGGACTIPRPIDFLLLSIGGNDIEFGKIIETCASPVEITVTLPFDKTRRLYMENCASTMGILDGEPGFIPYGGPGWQGNKFTHDVDFLIERLLAERLKDETVNTFGYHELNRQLQARLGVRPETTKVIVMPYPDPTVENVEGRMCSEFVFEDAGGMLAVAALGVMGKLIGGGLTPGGIITGTALGLLAFDNCGAGDPRGSDCPDGVIEANEILWARERVVQPLNRAIAATENLFGWTPLNDVPNEFHGHGYCSSSNFMIPYGNSWRTQGAPRADATEENLGMKGTMHPNRGGQEVFARNLAVAMDVKNPSLIAKPSIIQTVNDVSPAKCPDGQGMVGLSCRGNNCGVIEVMCKPLPRGVEPLANSTIVTTVSDETGPDSLKNQCGLNSHLVGLGCSGTECDWLSLHCQQLTAGKAKNCLWTESVTGDTHWNVFRSGKIANGARCSGPFCEKVQMLVCDYQPDPAHGEAHFSHPKP